MIGPINCNYHLRTNFRKPVTINTIQLRLPPETIKMLFNCRDYVASNDMG